MLVVSDDRQGMNKETLDNLYEPFFTTKKSGEGTGLGLSTVYGIIKQNNGFISVYSEPGQGASFEIYFPKTEETKATKEKSVVKQILEGSETVLLVEDEKTILGMVQSMLERAGYVVLTAK